MPAEHMKLLTVRYRLIPLCPLRAVGNPGKPKTERPTIRTSPRDSGPPPTVRGQFHSHASASPSQSVVLWQLFQLDLDMNGSPSKNIQTKNNNGTTEGRGLTFAIHQQGFLFRGMPSDCATSSISHHSCSITAILATCRKVLDF